MQLETKEIVRSLDDKNLTDKERKLFEPIPDTPEFNEAVEEILGDDDRAIATAKTKGGRKLLAWAEQKKNERNKRKRQRQARRKARKKNR